MGQKLTLYDNGSVCISWDTKKKLDGEGLAALAFFWIGGIAGAILTGGNPVGFGIGSFGLVAFIGLCRGQSQQEKINKILNDEQIRPFVTQEFKIAVINALHNPQKKDEIFKKPEFIQGFKKLREKGCFSK